MDLDDGHAVGVVEDAQRPLVVRRRGIKKHLAPLGLANDERHERKHTEPVGAGALTQPEQAGLVCGNVARLDPTRDVDGQLIEVETSEVNG